MDASSRKSWGRAGCPDVMRRFTSLGHRRVNAHQTTSRRKLLPSPLSPVTRFNRGAKSSAISGAGPTLSSVRCSIIACLRKTKSSTSGHASSRGPSLPTPSWSPRHRRMACGACCRQATGTWCSIGEACRQLSTELKVVSATHPIISNTAPSRSVREYRIRTHAAVLRNIDAALQPRHDHVHADALDGERHRARTGQWRLAVGLHGQHHVAETLVRRLRPRWHRTECTREKIPRNRGAKSAQIV